MENNDADLLNISTNSAQSSTRVICVFMRAHMLICLSMFHCLSLGVSIRNLIESFCYLYLRDIIRLPSCYNMQQFFLQYAIVVFFFQNQ